MQSLCTLRGHCRQWPRNTRYQAGATLYLGRTCTGWIAPACGWRTYSITSSRAQAASAEFRGRRLEVDHQLELGRSWAWRPHAEASYQPWLRWFRLRTAFCDFLEAATG